jgi:hypothetical protein
VERHLRPAFDTQDGDVVHLAHTRHAERRCLCAFANAARFIGLDVHDHIAARKGRLHGLLDAVGGRVALAHRLPGGTPITTSANWRPPASRMRNRFRSTTGRMSAIAARAAASASAGTRSISTSTFVRIRRAAAMSTSAATNRAAIESASW